VISAVKANKLLDDFFLRFLKTGDSASRKELRAIRDDLRKINPTIAVLGAAALHVILLLLLVTLDLRHPAKSTADRHFNFICNARSGNAGNSRAGRIITYPAILPRPLPPGIWKETLKS
jgi:hypothetical protein